MPADRCRNNNNFRAAKGRRHFIGRRGDMEIKVDTRPFAKIETDALVTYAFEQEKTIDSGAIALDSVTGGAISKLAASGELTGKILEATLLHYPQGLAAQRLLILGAGKKDKFGTVELRRLAGT